MWNLRGSHWKHLPQSTLTFFARSEKHDPVSFPCTSEGASECGPKEGVTQRKTEAWHQTTSTGLLCEPGCLFLCFLLPLQLFTAHQRVYGKGKEPLYPLPVKQNAAPRVSCFSMVHACLKTWHTGTKCRIFLYSYPKTSFCQLDRRLENTVVCFKFLLVVKRGYLLQVFCTTPAALHH